MKKMIFRLLTRNPGETKRLARLLAKEVLKDSSRKRQAKIIALEGPLASGKTTFAQGFGRGLGLKRRLTSPTFLIMRPYPLSSGRRVFWHMDCYRIKRKDILSLGVRDLIHDPGNIILIEWADRIRKVIPRESLWLSFNFGPMRDWRLIFLRDRK